MKCSAPILIAFSLMVGFHSSASRADTVSYDPFNYPAGPLGGQNGGTSWGGSWTPTDTGTDVTTKGLTFDGLITSGGKVTTNNNQGNFRLTDAPLGNPGTTTWVSFLTSQNSGSSFDGTYNGISLFDGASEELFMGERFNFDVYGVERSGSVRLNSTTLIDAITRFLVYSIDFGAVNDTINMYIDPTPGLANPDVTAAIANFVVPNFTFDNVRIQGNSGVGTFLNFDELRIGNTYADVSPASVESAAPLPNSAIQIAALAIGLLIVRRLSYCYRTARNSKAV